jgi:putative ABC transport system permease protein
VVSDPRTSAGPAREPETDAPADALPRREAPSGARSGAGRAADDIARARLTTGRWRWRTAARFLLRSLSLRGSTFLLALLAITVGATLTATMLGIRVDLRAKMSRELRRFGPNLIVVPRADLDTGAFGSAASPGASGATLGARTLAETDAARAVSAVTAAGLVTSGVVSPLLLATGAVAPAPPSGPAASAGAAARARIPSDAPFATVIGADLDALHRLDPSWRVEGAWPAPGESACLVGSSLAARASLAPGRTALVAVRGPGTAGGGAGSAATDRTARLLRVAGIVSTGEAEDDAVIVPLALLQADTGLDGRVSLVALSVDGGAEAVAQAASAVSAALPGAAARPLRQIAASQGAVLDKLGRMMLLLTLVVMTLSGLCLVTTLMTSVVERESEIGLMRSIGAGDFEIVSMFVGEVLLLGLGGGLLGTALGALAARAIGTRLFGTAIEPRVEIVPLVLAISLFLCLVSVLVPLRRALAIAPAAALRGD